MLQQTSALPIYCDYLCFTNVSTATYLAMSFLSSAEEAVKHGVSSGRANAAKSAWICQEKFCVELALDPLLQTIESKVAILQVFAQSLQSGEIAPKGNPIRSRTVEKYLQHVMGAKDLRKNSLETR